ncbi:restriction endonuclease subunit S [Pseudophaeobacter sp.]|uniref:restriction endonuclease subunit S n=1 Tax=Pseudophaeobacter sp. TaxID=1971739 RepID=UPI003298CD40
MKDIPNGWALATLADLGDWSSGGTPSRSKPEYFDGDIPFVKTGDLNDNWLSSISEMISESGLQNSSAKLFPEGTLLIAMYGATIGKTARLLVPAATNQACAALLGNEANGDSLNYVWAYLRSQLENLRASGKGGAQPNISQTLLKSFPIPLPPLAEQKRIVKKLDTISARSSRAHFDLQAIPSLVERYKLNFLRSVFRGEQTASFREENNLEHVSLLLEKTAPPEQGRGGRKATDETILGKGGISVNNPGIILPEGWSWAPLLRVARQETGHTPSRSHSEWWGGDVHWISIPDANTHHGRILHNTVQKTNKEGLANSSARILPEGTVVLSRTASVGYVTIMGREMATSQDFATWTCSEALEPKYLMYALMSEGDDIRDFGKGTTHTTIYFPEIRAFNIKLAPLEEQREIVRRVEVAFGMVERLATEAEKALKLINRLDQRILAKAFAGELVPQDPNDETASALLEWIKIEKKEREKATKEARKSRPARRTEPRRPKLTDLLDVLEQQKSWIPASKAAQGLGIGDGTSSDDIEGFYHQLKKYVESSAIEVERRDDEDWLRLAVVEAN